MTAVANTDIVGIILDFYDCALFFKIFNDRLSRFHSVHSGVLAPFGFNVSVIGKGVNYLKVMPQTDLEVIRIMSRSNLNTACSEVHFNIFIRNDGNLPVDDRQNKRFADNILVSLVVRVDGNGSITEHCLRSCCCKLEVTASVLERIAKMPEVTCLILVFNLSVGDRSQTVRTPVYYTLATVDKSFIIKVYENLFNSLAAALVHSEAFSVPVAGRAHLLELFNDPSAELFFPFPRSFEEALTSDILFRDTLLTHRFNYLRFGCNGSVIRTGKPKGVIALHSSVTDENVL